MAATRKPRSAASSSAAAGGGDHLRFLRPGALARLRDARLRRRKPASRLAPPSSPSPPPPSPPPPAAGAGEAVPYFAPASRFLSPRCPQRKKLAAAKSVMLFSPPLAPSPDLHVDAAMDFLNSTDMVVAAH